METIFTEAIHRKYQFFFLQTILNAVLIYKALRSEKFYSEEIICEEKNMLINMLGIFKKIKSNNL